MTEDQELELRRIRSEQERLRGQWEQLEERLTAVEGATRGEPAPMPVRAVLRPPAQPTTTLAPAVEPAAQAPPEPAVAVPRDSLEMRIGTIWLVRAGIVLLLTSLALAGNYLYQNVVPHLGPGGKVGLLYLAAALLTGFGAWLERSRQARELSGLQNYARVVLAGGLAAVYYVTYAAHYYPNLRVVESAWVAGLLLCGWAAFLVWLADRRESQILATFAILLAYYTSAINEVASFTLCSNLVLSAGAVYLLRRHLWRIFPFASLLATFGSYAFWHYLKAYPGKDFDLTAGTLRPAGGFWLEGGFLFVYWALFTWAVFKTDDRILPSPRRATFASLNNGAFFLLTNWLWLGEYPELFWQWSLACGVIFLGLGEVGRRLRPPLEAESENVYQLQGSLLITLGLIDYFSGWQLSLILAVQSRVLLAAAASRRRNAPFLPFAWLTALAALFSAVGGLRAAGPGSWLSALVVGAFFFEESWQCARLRQTSAAEATVEHQRQIGQVASRGFALLTAWIWFALIAAKITFPPAFAPVLALAAVALLSLGRVLRVPAIPFFAQVYLLAAQTYWLFKYGEFSRLALGRSPWWTLTALLALTLAFGQAWKLVVPGPARSAPAERLAEAWQACTMILGTLCGWIFVGHNLALLPGSAFNVPARWSLYAAAVFVVGLALRERVYRWLGLLILGATLGRVVLLDLWQIDLLERALSFLTLGVVLLGLGFFYTRFGSKVRDLF